eukprot:scaffold196077_cov18-Tisochrysis_lutea.AAC.5
MVLVEEFTALETHNLLTCASAQPAMVLANAWQRRVCLECSQQPRVSVLGASACTLRSLSKQSGDVR